MELLHVEGVSFSYDQYTVIKNLSFKVHEGDYVWVIGENGTGKSTLIKGLLNLKKPSSGQIIFNETLKQSEVGYLPQQTVIQKEFPASVWEIILSGCLNQCGWLPLYKKSDKERAVKWMKELGIYELRDCCYRELSGGQQQRVLLARALCATKKLLILDEPVETNAIAASPLIKLFSFIRSKKNAAATTTGIANDKGATFKTEATANARTKKGYENISTKISII